MNSALDTAPPARVVHLTSVHPREDTRIFPKMCSSLARAGYDVHLVVADGKQDAYVGGVHIHDVGRPSGKLIRMTWYAFKVFWKGLRLRASLYHFHDPELMPWGLILKMLGKKVIYDVHEHYVHTIANAHYLPLFMQRACSHMYGLLQPFASRFFDACIIVVPSMQEHIRSRRIAVIGNYVRLAEVAPYENWQNKEQAVCYIGLIEKQRGILEMIDAISRSDATLYLAGKIIPPTLREECIKKSGWAKVVEEGYIDRLRMQALFDRCRAGLLLLTPDNRNHYFSSPNKLFEYMAAGLPVIASDLPSVREVIEKYQCGILIDRLDVTATANAINWVLHNPAEAEAMGKRGRKAVERYYSWEALEKDLFGLYRDILTTDHA